MFGGNPYHGFVYSYGYPQTLLSFLLYSKGFYDEAVVLLNKAIKGEKKEKGLYINRGGKYTTMIILLY